MRLIQYLDGAQRCVGVADDDGRYRALEGVRSVRELALDAFRSGQSLAAAATARATASDIDIDALLASGNVLPPLDHPDPTRTIVGITGLTHLGGARSRDAMHVQLAAADLSDSMKMFKMGVEGGKPERGVAGVQPEWAYKGDGCCVVPPGGRIVQPGFAEDGGEEAEIAGLYVIGDAGEILRVGFALGNEYSDHVMEKRNYLYLAHSKMRPCSYGPELLIGSLPGTVDGKVRIVRGGSVTWEADFLSGEDNMCHSVGNLEAHHFKYAQFRRPGDVHVYFFGASVLSFSDGLRLMDGDLMEVEASPFGRPLRNRLGFAPPAEPVAAIPL